MVAVKSGATTIPHLEEAKATSSHEEPKNEKTKKNLRAERWVLVIYGYSLDSAMPEDSYHVFFN